MLTAECRSTWLSSSSIDWYPGVFFCPRTAVVCHDELDAVNTTNITATTRAAVLRRVLCVLLPELSVLQSAARDSVLWDEHAGATITTAFEQVRCSDDMCGMCDISFAWSYGDTHVMSSPSHPAPCAWQGMQSAVVHLDSAATQAAKDCSPETGYVWLSQSCMGA